MTHVDLPEPLLILLAQLRDQGPRQYSNWNSDTFDSYVSGPLLQLWKQRSSEQTLVADIEALCNYARLIAEGTGRAWLKPTDKRQRSNFLEYCLADLIPDCLNRVPSQKKTHALMEVWNLGEGLAREPAWLNQFAIIRTPYPVDLLRLTDHLITVLSPVFTASADATWKGPAELFVLNPVPVCRSFVPGRSYLASPSLLCVPNRIDASQVLGVLLLKSGRSEILGMVGDLPEYVESFNGPSVVAQGANVRIADTQVAAPWLTSIHHTLCVQSGFVILSPEDSQRLIVVEMK